jgi:hypothetical protein
MSGDAVVANDGVANATVVCAVPIPPAVNPTIGLPAVTSVTPTNPFCSVCNPLVAGLESIDGALSTRDVKSIRH